MFQFQYGAIGSKPMRYSIFPVPMFQFQYGAIGSIRKSLPDINSGVSIPVWCDWEYDVDSLIKETIRFQFQYGAIGSRNQQRQYCAGRCFNSSMVRLGGQNRNPKKHFCPVSIPVWCDWECSTSANG